MRRIRVEIAASIRAKHLNRELRSQRPLRDRLRSSLQGLGRNRRFEILNGSLPHKEQRGGNGNLQKDVQRTSRYINPEVSYCLGCVTGKTSDHSYCHRNTNGSGNEVLDCEPGHLNEVTEGRIRRIRLPVSIRHEADRRIECEVWSHRCRIWGRLRSREMHWV